MIIIFLIISFDIAFFPFRVVTVEILHEDRKLFKNMQLGRRPPVQLFSGMAGIHPKTTTGTLSEWRRSSSSPTALLLG